MKSLYKTFDLYAQSWFYARSWSIQQATVALRNQILKKNGRYKFQAVIKVSE